MKRAYPSPTTSATASFQYQRSYHSTSTSSSASLRQISDPLDCAALGSCLKRVKISVSSPGELRLTNDLVQLKTLQNWKPVPTQSLLTPPPASASPFFTAAQHEWQWCCNPSQTIFVARDPVDTLRLRVILVLPNQQWSLWMQFPRMYPHSPPVVYRMNDLAKISVRQRMHRFETRRPPCEDDHEVAVYHYDDWSPIRRLEDLLDWLLTLPLSESRMAPGESSSSSQMMDYDDCSVGVRVMLPRRNNIHDDNNTQPIRKHLESVYNPTRFDVGYPSTPAAIHNSTTTITSMPMTWRQTQERDVEDMDSCF